MDALSGFYQRQFQNGSWQLIERSSDHRGSLFVVRYKDLQVRVAIRRLTESESLAPTSGADSKSDSAEAKNGSGGVDAAPVQPDAKREAMAMSELLIQYVRDPANKTAANSAGSDGLVPKPGDAAFIGPVRPEDLAKSPNLAEAEEEDAISPQKSAANISTTFPFSDLAKVPPALQPWVQDVAQLGLLRPETSGAKTSQTSGKQPFAPNKPIARREYARWLVTANNRIYGTETAKQIRLGVETAKPAFQDVARTDPDFSAIQGLAEAGILASPLSGDATTVLFRPDAPLTREQLVLWKVPLDTRQGLPKATLEAVQQTWGFQDAARIDPKAMRAVLADFQNGDRANIRRVFGYTTLFQPQKPVTRAEAAAALWYFGTDGEGRSAREVLQLENASN